MSDEKPRECARRLTLMQVAMLLCVLGVAVPVPTAPASEPTQPEPEPDPCG